MADEFDLIRRHFSGLATDDPSVLHGIGDDCALLRPPPGRDLAASIDTLVAGVHFPRTTAAADIGWKALACGLSDLAAAGARPAWAWLALTCPEADERWLSDFANGFGALARQHGVVLAGGDTTRGPLSITVQVVGHVPKNGGLLRNGARVGDAILVSGWPGSAAAGLQRVLAGTADHADPLVMALNRPCPRVELGCWLDEGRRASACIDVSDGLAADLGHILDASGVGAVLELERLPCSTALRAAGDRETVRQWILTGGDDYELCLTAPAEPALAPPPGMDVPLTRIGRVVAEEGLYLQRAPDRRERFDPSGYRHFFE